MSATEKLLAHIEALACAPFGDGVREQVQLCLIDYVGCAVAGAAASPFRLCEAGLPSGRARILGTSVCADPLSAALWNGVHAHILEFDDGHRRAMMHLGAPVFSALLAAYDSSVDEISDDRFIAGAVCGYQAAVVLAQALQPAHKLRGFHATGTCGTVGAAVAVAVMKGYDRNQLATCLAVAATSGAGLLEVVTGPSQLKPYNAGRAAMDGLSAALFAQSAVLPPDDMIGGRRGFLQVLCGQEELPELEIPVLDDVKIMGVFRKPYAACRHCHAPIEAALTLRKKEELDVSRIESVVVRTYDLAVFGHDDAAPQNASAAKMSTPFCVASALRGATMGILSFSDELCRDEALQGIMARVQVVSDEEVSSWLPERRGCKLEINLQGGRCFEHVVEYPLGEPENPLRKEDVAAKFRDLHAVSANAEAWDAETFLKAIFENGISAALKQLR